MTIKVTMRVNSDGILSVFAVPPPALVWSRDTPRGMMRRRTRRRSVESVSVMDGDAVEFVVAPSRS